MVSILNIVVLATLAVFANGDTDYCSLPACKGPTHTLCKFNYEETDDSQCGEIGSSTLDDDEIQEILDTHNRMRAYVASGQETRGSNGPQPAATNLGPLQWDDELAGIAQTWADQCHYGHDACNDVERFPVGENIAYSGSTANWTATWSGIMDQWYNEVDKFDGTLVSTMPVSSFAGTTHYTQLMWANTQYVGCGGIRYHADGDIYYRTYLVCNYGPAGNYPGMAMYEVA